MNKLYTNTAPYSILSKTVYDMIEELPQRLFFSIFEEVEGEEDPLCRYPDITSTDIIFEGNVKFIIKDYDEVKEPIFSLPLLNPTWKDIICAANDMLIKADITMGFLEDIVPIDAGVYELIIS